MNNFLPKALTARLAIFYAVITFLILSAVGTYLYRALALQLSAREDHELIEKIAQFRHILLETPNSEAIANNQHRFIDAATGHHGLIVILRRKNGEDLMGNQSSLDVLALGPVAPVAVEPEPSFIRTWEYDSGQSVRTVSAWGRLGHSSEEIQIIVGRTAADRSQLLSDYSREVLATIAGASILAAICGYVVVRHLLRPLKVVARQAHTITAQRLDRRLDARMVPPEVQALVESFNSVLDRLQESFLRLSQFSGDLAHDLRTPLYNLTMQTQVALSQKRSESEYITLLGSSLEEYERLARMVESMLFLARADNAQVAISLQELDATEEMQRIANYFEGIADDANVKIAVHGNGKFVADAALFLRAVSNLVANAIRFTPSGSTIDLRIDHDEDFSIVTVSNPGVGIEPKHLGRLFDRFYRIDESRSGSTSSMGLGLAIVDSIMKLHGGKAEVHSEANGMTTFCLSFPVRCELR